MNDDIEYPWDRQNISKNEWAWLFLEEHMLPCAFESDDIEMEVFYKELLVTKTEQAEYIKELELKLNQNKCNSGHETLPVYLWNCPRCMEIKEDKYKKKIEMLEKACRALINKLGRAEAEYQLTKEIDACVTAMRN